MACKDRNKSLCINVSYSHTSIENDVSCLYLQLLPTPVGTNITNTSESFYTGTGEMVF